MLPDRRSHFERCILGSIKAQSYSIKGHHFVQRSRGALKNFSQVGLGDGRSVNFEYRSVTLCRS
jgi:hypothetical protein